jgi:hypothetical protein
MAAEESVLIAEAFHIVCIFRKKDLMMIDAKVITGERQIASKQNNGLALPTLRFHAHQIQLCSLTFYNLTLNTNSPFLS